MLFLPGQDCRRFIGTLLLVLVVTPWVGAQQIVLNFDELAASSNITAGSFVPTANRLSNGYLSTFGVTFSSTGGYVGVMQFGAGHAVSGLNCISGSTPTNTVSYSDLIVATFFSPVNPSDPAVTNFVSLRTDLQASFGTVSLQAFNLNGDMIDSQTTNDFGGTLLSVSAPGIHSVKFQGQALVAGVDDFTFNTVVAVPEPSSLILAGLSTVILAGVLTSQRKVRRLFSRRKHALSGKNVFSNPPC